MVAGTPRCLMAIRPLNFSFHTERHIHMRKSSKKCVLMLVQQWWRGSVDIRKRQTRTGAHAQRDENMPRDIKLGHYKTASLSQEHDSKCYQPQSAVRKQKGQGCKIQSQFQSQTYPSWTMSFKELYYLKLCYPSQVNVMTAKLEACKNLLMIQGLLTLDWIEPV